MSGDYLWDGSGEPDAELARIEAALRPLRRVPPPPQWTGVRPALGGTAWRPALAAAAVVLAAGSALLPRPSTRPGWDLTWVAEGDARGPRRMLSEGEWLDTGARRARLAAGDVGEVRLEPRTRVAVIDAGRAEHRLSLARGRLHATIWAPPGRFFVDTPAAVAVDLGCEYTLEVAADGSGRLRVLAGWVGFEHAGVKSLVPAGASCLTRPCRGPGTPRFDTATDAFESALDALDDGPSPDARAAVLERVLSAARPRDALSLWHLLPRVPTAERGRVFDALAARVPPPAGVTRDGVVAGAGPMRDLWWDELGLGSSEFWRMWTRPAAVAAMAGEEPPSGR